MLFRRRRSAEPESVEPSSVDAGLDDLEQDAARIDTELLTATIARHFDGAEIEGTTVRIDPPGLRIECEVAALSDTGSGVAASLYFSLSGPAFGAHPVFASISGYGSAPNEAIAEGACLWCCSFGPALRSALTGLHEDDADEFDVTLDGRPYRVHVGNLDRTMRSGDGPDIDTAALIQDVRTALGGTPLVTPLVLASGTLPVLPADALSVVSVFVMQNDETRTVEVKIGGRDWPASEQTFAGRSAECPDGIVLLRELAVLVPAGPALPLQRAAIERTLAGIAAISATPAHAHGWPGWRAHGGVLDAPLTTAELAVIEATTGELPEEYRRFVTTVAASGAGPGYGLLRPAVVNDVLPLAHAGCGVTWVLRLDAPHRGEVWVDAAGSDETYQRVAASFEEWYEQWLDAAVRSGPWTQWDTMRCATASLIVELLESPDGTDAVASVGAEGIALTGGGAYLPAGSAVDPCHGCVELVARFGLGDDVFAPGILSAPPN